MSSSLMPNIYDFLVNLDPFDKLTDADVKMVSEQVKITYLAKGEEIHFSADCLERFLYVIRTGAVEQRMADGSLRSRLGEQDQFGFTFLDPLTNAEDGYTAVAIADSLLYMIPHRVLQQLLNANPNYSEFFDSKARSRLNSALYHPDPNGKGPYYRKVSEVASENITTVDKSMSIKDVAYSMGYSKRSSAAVVLDGDEIIGVISDRDMTVRVVAKGLDTSSPIEMVMTPNPQLINGDATVLEAISLMLQYNIRSLPVVQHRQVIGLITTTHLVHNHRTQALFLIEKIKYANTVESLKSLKDERITIFNSLVESCVSSRIIASVMSMLMDAFNRRLIQLAEEKLGPPPCDYAWMVAGSHARNEVHLLSDQDNALVLSDDVTEKDMEYFTQLAHMVCRGLDECDYPLCEGKYMAATPKWCQPVSRWKRYYTKWVGNPEYNKLLNISVFLEVRSIHGNSDLVEQLQQHLHECIAESHRFIPSLVRDAVATQPPLGIFNNLVLEKSGTNSRTLNIKKFALNLIIDLARIYSLSAKGNLTGTAERFQFAYEAGVMQEDSCKNILGAYRFITQVRFTHQKNALKAGKLPDNNIDPKTFSSFERKHLKDAFKIIHELQDGAKLRFTDG